MSAGIFYGLYDTLKKRLVHRFEGSPILYDDKNVAEQMLVIWTADRKSAGRTEIGFEVRKYKLTADGWKP